MQPPFQIPTAGLTGAALTAVQQTNSDIAAQQQRYALLSKNSLTYVTTSAITAAASGYGVGDPNDGAVNAGTGLAWDSLTQTQQLLFVYRELPNPFASADLADIAAILEANPGPNEAWNWSNVQCGVVPNVPGILPQGSVITVQGSSAKITTGMQLPS